MVNLVEKNRVFKLPNSHKINFCGKIYNNWEHVLAEKGNVGVNTMKGRLKTGQYTLAKAITYPINFPWWEKSERIVVYLWLTGKYTKREIGVITELTFKQVEYILQQHNIVR